MDAREQRGLVIAATSRVVQKGDVWLVQSQSGPGKYTVNPDKDTPHCSCPDHDKGFVCKHIHAVRFVLIRTTQEENVDGTTTTTTETLTVTQTVEKRKTYRQDWPAYNAAQTNERRHFHELLGELCSTIQQPEPKNRAKGGRPTIPLRDGLFAACLKVCSLMSARRFNGELEEAHERGYIGCTPHFNYALGILDKEETTPMLKSMIETSSLPLTAIETDFAVDSTGFATTKYASWFDMKYNQMKEEQTWVKAHFATGVKTNIVTAVIIDHQSAADSPQLPALTDQTAENFTIREMSGDKAYAALENFHAVEKHGGKFFPMFKSNATGAVGGSFYKALHFLSFNRDEYLAHYHKRSNVESTVAMVKRKFGDAVKAKNDVAQKNEVYAKFVCHNICVLISEMLTLGIDPTFAKPTTCTETGHDARILKFPG